jgi:hypothetical protein
MRKIVVVLIGLWFSAHQSHWFLVSMLKLPLSGQRVLEPRNAEDYFSYVPLNYQHYLHGLFASEIVRL